MQLKRLLFIALISALIVPVVITTAVFATSILSFLTNKVETSDLPTALEEVKNAVELDLQGTILPSRSLANNMYIKRWMQNGEPSQGVDVLTSHLAEIKRESNAISAYVVSGNSNNYYTHDGIDRQITPQGDTWFQTFINSSQPFEIAIDIDKSNGVASAFINYAIKIEGERVALAGVGLSLEAMSKLIASYKVAESGIVYLVDDAGNIALHPDMSKRGEKLNASAFVDKPRELEVSSSDVTRLAVKLDSLDWYLVTEVPTSELYGAINTAVLTNILIALVIIALGLVGMRFLSNKIFAPIDTITGAVTSLNERDGDLTARLNINEDNEIGALSAQIDLFLEKLHAMFIQVSESAQHVKGIAAQVYEQIELSQSYSSRQTDSTNSVAAAIEEMDLTVREISNSAQGASEVANTTEENVSASANTINKAMQNMSELSGVMTKSVNSVNELSSSINSISSILDEIRGISEQTNLLALNAAIEAARAGEQGRGFAVVADEVRNLASRTNESTTEISQLMDELNKRTSDTVADIMRGNESTQATSEFLSTCVQALSNISAEVSKLTEANTHVASATREQSAATGEISENISVISQTAEETSRSMERSYSLVNELDDEAKALDKTISKFTL
ncbi:methyl-accepting chemotaxis protein [Alteromonas sp. BL110]|uniref:methyl-accepting chemotaxis protein n=1 Tax=Alteromonas sp. BL110 TaxID=1714845 RepID=UPI000E47970E|nr:methyl-accepting chemotaxis protein [Alteromonas sp. BL110]AXT39340.1 methyl-accepting chemotaxis protein [Alteromonas sp. BL110]RKM82175.1 HAMP domain-containing protein [Alteromonas sp. BL110]